MFSFVFWIRFLGNQFQLPFLIIRSFFVSYTSIFWRNILFCTNKLMNWKLWGNLAQKKYACKKKKYPVLRMAHAFLKLALLLTVLCHTERNQRLFYCTCVWLLQVGFGNPIWLALTEFWLGFSLWVKLLVVPFSSRSGTGLQHLFSCKWNVLFLDYSPLLTGIIVWTRLSGFWFICLLSFIDQDHVICLIS